ncbi:MAG: FAD-dependent oxidoreductase [Xanthomonadales bacterium]|nr:FAD-dependent oxidoreductase [Xanthomonadales bacterium]
MSTTHTDVLICGAGAAGLTLAIDLARRGVDFRLVDKLAAPFPGSRGKGIQPRTLEVFEDLGIVQAILAAGGPYPPQRVHAADGSHADTAMVAEAAATPAEPYALPWMCPQATTERIMRERLAGLGGHVQAGCELIGFEEDADGVTATLAGAQGRETVHARYLVGTDGGRSFVRRTLGIDFPGKTLGVRAMVADLELDGLPRDAWHRFGGEVMEQTLSLCPLAGTALFQMHAAVPPDGEVDVSLSALQSMVEERAGRADIRLRAVAWASVYRMHARLAARYRIGRVLLAGDAAHTHPPTGGQGLNTSIQDAYNLGWKLAAVLAGAPAALLDSYEEERRPVAADVLGLSTRLLDAARRGDNRRSREARQLDLGYRDSVLAMEAPTRSATLRAGDRAPDAPLADASSGAPVRVFELLAGPHWTLLGHATDPGAIATHPGLRVHVVGGEGGFIDAQGHFRDAWALPPGHWALVRPDGHIGAFVAADRLPALHDHLTRVLGSRAPVQLHRRPVSTLDA